MFSGQVNEPCHKNRIRTEMVVCDALALHRSQHECLGDSELSVVVDIPFHNIRPLKVDSTQRPPPTHLRSAQGPTGIPRIDHIPAPPLATDPLPAYFQLSASIRCAPHIFAASSVLAS
ncbi:hypothetical protein FA95DRAFT_1612060 [Auriscalpium vulgare]|uniref:Uncharacterized protein n=1 Tax=Auriscalpium vulgare TaxID=40419 RepID=A0ACB8R7J2_9AGAM|nr:hypothetical protein FA95DRAFT_1612060 [Auriscalpium vulgare]